MNESKIGTEQRLEFRSEQDLWVSPADEVVKSEAVKSEVWRGETYEAMHRMAAKFMSGESQTVSLSPTILIHEVFVKLSKQRTSQYQSRSHLLAVASTMMRRILVDHARARARTKRGGQYVRVSYCETLAFSTERDADVLALEESLQELATLDSLQAKIVEMRFFGGMTVPEVAEVLGLSTRTIENEWKLSRAWLRKRIDEADS